MSQSLCKTADKQENGRAHPDCFIRGNNRNTKTGKGQQTHGQHQRELAAITVTQHSKHPSAYRTGDEPSGKTANVASKADALSELSNRLRAR